MITDLTELLAKLQRLRDATDRIYEARDGIYTCPFCNRAREMVNDYRGQTVLMHNHDCPLKVLRDTLNGVKS